jgi:4-amino-4-deoxy-L-arabinose transferase-like glycosyltransferase
MPPIVFKVKARQGIRLVFQLTRRIRPYGLPFSSSARCADTGKNNLRNVKTALLGILGVALLARLGAACVLQALLDGSWHRDFLIEGDAEGYWLLAQQLARGADYAIYTPPRYVLRMPGFPALLSVPILLFGTNLFAARLFLAVIGTFTCWLVYRLGRSVLSEQSGLVASAMAAISPVFIVFSVEPLSETAFAAMLLIALISGNRLFHLLERDANAWPIAGQGILTGLAIAGGVYVRPSWLLAGPLVLVLLALLSKRRLRALGAGCLVVLGMLLALLPWGFRNQQVTGHFTLTTFWMGPSLYDGLNPRATGESDMRFFDDDRLPARMGEYEVDQFYRRAAWDFARQHPRRVLELAAVKFWRYWNPIPNAGQFKQPLLALVVCLFFVPVLLLAISGTVRLFRPSSGSDAGRSPEPGIRRRAIWSMAILAGPIIYFSALHLVFVSSLRYRLPAEYPLLILSAWGLLAVVEAFRPPIRRMESPR